MVLLGILMSTASFASTDFTKEADQLNDLGLFSGTQAGYELNRIPSRVEGLAMLVRLLGKTEEAESNRYEHPFIDIPNWANASVGYAYKMGLAKGISETTFGARAPLDGNAYATFILRALNYNDLKGDFNWQQALILATEMGLVSGADKVGMQETFTRNDLVGMSYNALSTPLKGQTRTLMVHLIQRGAVSKEKAIALDLVKAESLEKPVVTIVVSGYGKIVAELYPEMAPTSVNNFITLAEKGFYDGLTFHRVIKDFMIQGGCPIGNGTGGPGYGILGEFSSNGIDNTLSHDIGVLSMARAQAFDSGGSQFFIVHKPAKFLDGSYAAFGKVIDGMAVVDKIAAVKTDTKDMPIELVTIEQVIVDRKGYKIGNIEKSKE